MSRDKVYCPNVVRESVALDSWPGPFCVDLSKPLLSLPHSAHLCYYFLMPHAVFAFHISCFLGKQQP